MLVYGDQHREEAPRDLLRRVGLALDEAARAERRRRHACLVAALIEAGTLAQGVADHGFAERGEIDDHDRAAETTLALACALARCVARSWDSGFADAGIGAGGVRDAIRDVADIALPPSVSTREPEGFAHYAVYPEAYLEAARTIPDGPLCLIGLRSIGTSLAAMVAAARTQVPLVLTLRPIGHPFARRVALSDTLQARLAARAECRFAIADEGPGLSGSSIAAAIELVAGLGVPAGRLHVLPSHGGDPGPESGPAVRAAWARASRHVTTFDDVVLRARSPTHRLATWCAELVGPLREEPVEMAGGGWRPALGLREAAWPPVNAAGERRKFLLRSESGTWIAKFVGLGAQGERKLALARHLAEAGFAPEPAGLLHGFLVERWHADARPLGPRSRPAGFVGRLGRYLALRAQLEPPPGLRGAPVAELLAMLIRNAGEALGPDVAAAIEAEWTPRLARLEAIRRPVMTDNRLQAWEWIETDGRVLKTDALDHYAGHDLVGPQDLAWDLAGAGLEFDLDADERAGLMAALGASPDHELVQFMALAYSAFQLGSATLARESAASPERNRLDGEVARYRDALLLCSRPYKGFTAPQGPA